MLLPAGTFAYAANNKVYLDVFGALAHATNAFAGVASQAAGSAGTINANIVTG
jgi:hypothetical protein